MQTALGETNDQRFSNLFYEYLCLIQKYAQHTNRIYLCLAPIGTNLLMLASELSINVKMRRRTIAVEGAYSFDRRYIRNFNRDEGTHHTVLPWVLQRFADNYSNPNPWTIWFQDLIENDVECAEPVARIAELEIEMAKLRPLINSPHIIEIGMCIEYASRLSSFSQTFVSPSIMVDEQPCVGVHIRRGDASDEKLENSDPGRKNFPLKRYIDEMETYLAKGFTHFYLLTESQLEISRIADHFGDRCKISYQSTDRDQFPNLHGRKHGKANFIEYLCLDNPDLVEFSMRTALIDLDNASRCAAIIGSFESSFSYLAFLKSVGRHKSIIDYSDLAGDKSGSQLFYPNLAENRETTLFVIKERDVGFFSLFLQVVNTLLYIDLNGPGLIPYVHFTDKQEYYTDTETWEEYFQPLVFMNKMCIHKPLSQVDRKFLAYNWEMRQAGHTGLIYYIKNNLCWSMSYYPRRLINRKVSGNISNEALRITRLNSRKILAASPKFIRRAILRIQYYFLLLIGRQDLLPDLRKKCEVGDGQISHITVPNSDERRRASIVIGNFINQKPAIREKVAELFKNYTGHYVIGVQFRGTDARMEPGRIIPEYQDYVSAISQHLEIVNSNDEQEILIFVASDEAEFINFIKKQFENVIFFDAVRHTGTDKNTKSRGKTGWGMPSFIATDRKKALEGAILDYAGLCHCDYMIHNFGSLTNAVLLTKPEIENHLVSTEYQHADAKIR